MGNREVVIPLHSPRGLVYISVMSFFRAMTHVFTYASLPYSHLLDIFYLVFHWHRGVRSFVGVVLRTLGLRCL